MWHLDTARGIYAVKESFQELIEKEAAADFDYQEKVLASGSVPMPQPMRPLNGTILGNAGERRVRVYEWVDLLPMTVDLDPVLVGETVAAIHRIGHDPTTRWVVHRPGRGGPLESTGPRVDRRQSPFCRKFLRRATQSHGSRGFDRSTAEAVIVTSGPTTSSLLPAVASTLSIGRTAVSRIQAMS